PPRAGILHPQPGIAGQCCDPERAENRRGPQSAHRGPQSPRPDLYLGATMGSTPASGFGTSFLGTLLFGVTLDEFGGTSQLASWAVSFGACGLACLAGAAATVFLPRNIWQR